MSLNGVLGCITSYADPLYCVDYSEPDFGTYIYWQRLKVRQKSRIDTIKYQTRPESPNGQVTKTQENIIQMRAKRSVIFIAGDHTAARNRHYALDSVVVQRQNLLSSPGGFCLQSCYSSFSVLICVVDENQCITFCPYSVCTARMF